MIDRNAAPQRAHNQNIINAKVNELETKQSMKSIQVHQISLGYGFYSSCQNIHGFRAQFGLEARLCDKRQDTASFNGRAVKNNLVLIQVEVILTSKN